LGHFHKHELLASAFLELGFDAEVIGEMLEATLYTLLSIQLKNLLSPVSCNLRFVQIQSFE